MFGSLLLGGAAYFAVFGGDYDLFDLHRVRGERAHEEQRVEEVRAEVDRLRARRDSLLHDSATIERVARERYGLIRPGERLYRFADAPPPPVQEPAAAPDEAAAGASPSAPATASPPRRPGAVRN